MSQPPSEDSLLKAEAAPIAVEPVPKMQAAPQKLKLAVDSPKKVAASVRKLPANLKTEKLRRRAKVYLSILLVLIIIGAAVYHISWTYLSVPGKYPIKKVEVMGTYQYVRQVDIEHALAPFVEKGLFGMPELQAERAVRAIPGVEDASIWRIYPDKIRVIVREKTAIALLNNQLLAADGTIFQQGDAPTPNIPSIEGNASYLKVMLKMLESISPVFAEANLKVTGLGLLENGDWRVQVNGMTWITLGKDDLVNRVSNFLNIYPTLIQSSGGQIPMRVDLRYPHGFTVVWPNNAAN